MAAVVQILIAVMICVLFMCCIITVKSKIEYTRSLVRLFLCAVFTMLAYSGFLFSRAKAPALFFTGVYFACTDWLIICMFLFCADYTQLNKKSRISNIIIYGVAFLDTASLMLNNVWHFMFDITTEVNTKTGEVYWINVFRFPQYVHLAFCYIIISLAFAALIYKAARTPGIYNGPYVSMIVPFFGVVVCNFICYSLNLQVDVSVLLYAALAGVICYLSVFVSPKILLNNMLSKVNGEIKDAIICYDIYGNLVYTNHTAHRIFFDENNKDKLKNSEVMRETFPERPEIGNDGIKENKVTMLIDGEERYFIVELINLNDGEDKVGLLIKMTDNTDKIKAFEEDKIKTTYDSLTGIYNREKFLKEAERVMKEDPDTPRYMIASDIKDFKMINELFGQDVGDEILKRQAALIKKFSHKQNVYGRIVGDKFALFMPCKYYNEDKFLKVIESMQSLADESIYKMHVYIGVYKVTDISESVAVMYDKAQMTAESAKGDYQRVFIHYDDTMMKQVVYDNNILSEFGDAMSEGQFELYLKPQVDREKNVVGAEAFGCWVHPVRGVLMPDEFYPVLEKKGHAHLLDVVIWKKAVKQLARWSDMGRDDMHISISVSSKDFYYLNIYDVLTEYVEEYGVNPHNLKIETTETSLMSNITKFMELSVKLQKYGFELEIDNFGRGYSSLNMLKDINADSLKIDIMILNSFLGDNIDERSKIIFKTIIDMAGKLGMKVIIDGVSNESQDIYLKKAGCEYFQGDYYYKMMSAPEFDNQFVY
ncbi:MAG: EAL domain-containing protein [Lachnospiraceae bacterium]|nr:EAL domain-containing protein [Lachnospiraceae bacterium]